MNPQLQSARGGFTITCEQVNNVTCVLNNGGDWIKNKNKTVVDTPKFLLRRSLTRGCGWHGHLMGNLDRFLHPTDQLAHRRWQFLLVRTVQ